MNKQYGGMSVSLFITHMNILFWFWYNFV